MAQERIASHLGNTKDEYVRLFIAAEVPQDILTNMVLMQDYIKKRRVLEGTYTHQAGMHITLAFLGAIAREQVEPIIHALHVIKVPPMQAQLGDFDVFTSRDRITVLFVPVHCPALVPLVKQIEQQLAPWYTREERSFIAHITLARVKHVPDPERFIAVLREYPLKKQNFVINRLVLKQSVLTPDGPLYTDLATYPLE